MEDLKKGLFKYIYENCNDDWLGEFYIMVRNYIEENKLQEVLKEHYEIEGSLELDGDEDTEYLDTMEEIDNAFVDDALNTITFEEKPITEEYKCPLCGADLTDSNIYDSVCYYIDDNTKLTYKYFKCHECGVEGSMDYTTKYKDSYYFEETENNN